MTKASAGEIAKDLVFKFVARNCSGSQVHLPFKVIKTRITPRWQASTQMRLLLEDFLHKPPSNLTVAIITHLHSLLLHWQRVKVAAHVVFPMRLLFNEV